MSLELDRNCWVCAIWLLRPTVAGLALSPFPFQDQNGQVTVECSNHFAHTQQFLSNAILTLLATGLSLAATSLETSRRSGWGKNGRISASRFRYNATDHRPLLRGLDDQAPEHIPLLGINSVVPHYRDNSNMLNNSSMLGFGINYMKRQQMSWYLATII